MPTFSANDKLAARGGVFLPSSSRGFHRASSCSDEGRGGHAAGEPAAFPNWVRPAALDQALAQKPIDLALMFAPLNPTVSRIMVLKASASASPARNRRLLMIRVMRRWL